MFDKEHKEIFDKSTTAWFKILPRAQILFVAKHFYEFLRHNIDTVTMSIDACTEI